MLIFYSSFYPTMSKRGTNDDFYYLFSACKGTKTLCNSRKQKRINSFFAEKGYGDVGVAVVTG